MHEGPEGPEGAEAPTEEGMEEFRERVFEDHGLEGLEDLPEGGSDPGRVPEQPGEAVDDQLGPSQEGAAHEEQPGPDLDPMEGSEGKRAAAADEPEATKDGTKDDTQENAAGETEMPATIQQEPPEKEQPDLIRKDAELSPPDKPESPGPPEEITEDATKIESFNQNDDQIVVTELESPEGPDKAPPSHAVETWDFHHFPAGTQAEQEEGRVFEAVDYGKGANVRFSVSDLEEKGAELERGEDAVVGMRLKDVQSEEVETVFARFNAGDRRAEAYIDDISGEKGSQYELLEAWKVDEDKLVGEFERGRCEHLENVRLEHAEDKMFLSVDDRRVELEDYRISTSGAHAMIRGRLDGDDRCKIELDGRRASVMFGRDYPVEGMRMEGDELVVRWAQSRNERHETRLYLEHLETPERPSLNQFDRPDMLEHVQALNRPPGPEGMYKIAPDGPVRDEIRNLLTDAPDYGIMKAEISERLIPNVLESLGWQRIERHPFAEARKENAGTNGTDWLMRDPDGNIALVEVKWYENRKDGIKKASSQVDRDFQTHRDDIGLNLKAAYIAIVDYDEDSPGDNPMKIHVVRIASMEEMR